IGNRVGLGPVASGTGRGDHPSAPAAGEGMQFPRSPWAEPFTRWPRRSSDQVNETAAKTEHPASGRSYTRPCVLDGRPSIRRVDLAWSPTGSPGWPDGPGGEPRECGVLIAPGEHFEQTAVNVVPGGLGQGVERFGIDQVAAGYLNSRRCRSKSRSDRPRGSRGPRAANSSENPDVPAIGSSSGASPAKSK